MPAWMCECGKPNRAKATRCPKCGADRLFEPGAKDPAKHELPTCAWETEDRRCLFLATVWIGLSHHRDAHGEITRPGYCSWHAMALDTPNMADDFDEFERWQLALLTEGYCTEFLHHRTSYLWATLHGQWRADAEREPAHPCASAGCWVRELTEPSPRHGRVPPAQAKAHIRGILATLVRKVTV